MACYVFGPVPSRRLGRSLGLDLVPFKTCSYDCIYCQLARTTCKTLLRKEWVPLEDILAQLKEKLATNPNYITLSGSGEPSLYSRIDELIAGIKNLTDIPVAVLTNGSLLSLGEVRSALLRADLVAPSLDAGDAGTFARVNRPAEGITFEQMVAGLITFRKEYKGQYWLEVFLLAGVNDAPEQLRKIAQIARQINPDRIQLNTVSRPAVEEYAVGVPEEQMRRFAEIFGAGAEVIADYRPADELGECAGRPREILEMLSRRPCTAEDIAQGLGLNLLEVRKHLQYLSVQGLVQTQTHNDQLYYLAINHGPFARKTKQRDPR